jgi:3-deoxy-D-manno-octulosonic-acid transferase
LCIVPRHPQRFDEVATLVREAGLNLSRRSAWPQGLPDAAAQSADVWLGDSMGEMPVYYAAARVALLGGSFAPLGGQNLIEAAACGCPVVMGPSTFNFAEAAALSEQAGAALRVADWAEGVAQALRVCEPAVQGPMSARALGFAQAHRGAAQAMAEAIWAAARAD